VDAESQSMVAFERKNHGEGAQTSYRGARGLLLGVDPESNAGILAAVGVVQPLEFAQGGQDAATVSKAGVAVEAVGRGVPCGDGEHDLDATLAAGDAQSFDLGGGDGGGVGHQDTSDGSRSCSVGPRISRQLIGLPDAMAALA